MSKMIILIDDQELIHMVWKLKAKSIGQDLLCFYSPKDFLKEKLSTDITIYIDSELSNGEKGEIVAIELIKLGYKNIYLCTGHSPEDFKDISYLKGITGKKPPF